MFDVGTADDIVGGLDGGAATGVVLGWTWVTIAGVVITEAVSDAIGIETGGTLS